jgi:hypothetical protein
MEGSPQSQSRVVVFLAPGGAEGQAARHFVPQLLLPVCQIRARRVVPQVRCGRRLRARLLCEPGLPRVPLQRPRWSRAAGRGGLREVRTAMGPTEEAAPAHAQLPGPTRRGPQLAPGPREGLPRVDGEPDGGIGASAASSSPGGGVSNRSCRTCCAATARGSDTEPAVSARGSSAAFSEASGQAPSRSAHRSREGTAT